jgi:hypothetical protein
VRRHHVTLAALSCVAIAAVIAVGGVTVNEGALERDPISLWTRTIGKPEVTERSEHVHAGRRALELTIQGPAAIGLEKYVNAGLHRLFLRYYLKYDDTFPGAHHVGGTLSARAPGVPETAPEQFYPSGRTMRYGASSDRRSLLGRTSCPRAVSGTAMS